MYCRVGEYDKVVRVKQMIDRPEELSLSLLGRFLTTIDRVITRAN